MNKQSFERKRGLEVRFATYGIHSLNITYLPYLDFEHTSFASPYEAQCRVLIFLAIAQAASNAEQRDDIGKWLQRENLWEHVSASEKAFFAGKVYDERTTADLSWQIENAYILAWALTLVPTLPLPRTPTSSGTTFLPGYTGRW